MSVHWRVAVTAATVGVCGVWLHSQQAPPASAYQFRYHTYAESTGILKDLAARYPKLARLYSVGKSATGAKELWYIEVGNQDTGAADEKPAVYFDGNQHAGEVMGGEVTLHLANYVLSNYGKDPAVTRLVDTRVLYIVQRADPDGAEAYMTGKIDWDPARAEGAVDRDHDGKIGEDGPDDIDGDGEIVKMRIADPSGSWKKYKDDARIMVPRQKGDTEGTFYRVLDEGIDNDGDGKVNEDPPNTSFISNRNYPAFWSSPDGRYRGAGDRPLQEHNALLIVDFILSHRNVAELESWHTTSGIHLRPYAARPDTEFPPQDLQDFSAVLAKGTELTGYPVASVYNDFTDVVPGLQPDEQPGLRHGVFIDWAYVQRGIFAVTTELWTMEPFLNEVGWGNIPRDKPLFAIPGRYNRPDVETAVLKWLDTHKGDKALAGQGFVEWHAFRHPTLGDVEIGGFTRYFPRNPPPGPYFEKVAVDQAKFAVVQALTTPLVKVRKVDVRRDTGGSGYLVTATVINEGYLDTSTLQGRLIKVAPPVEVVLDVPPGVKVADARSVSIPFLRGQRGSWWEHPYTATWHVEAPEGTKATVVLKSEKGGTDRKAFTIGRSGTE